MKIENVDKLPSEEEGRSVKYPDLKTGQCFKFNNTGCKSHHLRRQMPEGHRSLEDGSVESVVEKGSMNYNSTVTLYDVEIYAKERR